MRYFGSKATTVERVYELIAERVPSGTFCDAFGGLGFVGSHFKSKGYQVWTGDILTFAHYFQLARIQLDRTVSFRRLRSNMHLDAVEDVVDILNTLKPRNGWLVEEYAKKRRFFTLDNAMRAQSCRLQIDAWSRNKWLSSHERAVLLASLINSMDRVANTAGTYYAYLKAWHRKALLPFRFELIRPIKGNPGCSSILVDAKDLVASRKFDVLYLDPPYNERSYSTYYHLPESIAKGARPGTHGKSGMPNQLMAVSEFNRPAKAMKALEELIKAAKFRLLAFHYSDDGHISRAQLKSLFSQYGNVEEFTVRSKGYTTLREPRTIKHRLYLVKCG